MHVTEDASEELAQQLALASAEVRRLRRQLRREQARRQAVEPRDARADEELGGSLRDLRAAQAGLLETTDQARVAGHLARALRHDVDAAALVNRVARSVGRVAQVDRCDVLLVDADRYSAVRGSWCSGPEAEALPQPDAFVDLPEALVALLMDAAQRLEPLQVEHVVEDDRLGAAGAEAVRRALAVAALLAVPVAVGDEVIGWLLLSCVSPRAWLPSDVRVAQGLSDGLVAGLVQTHGVQQQREAMQRLEELDRAKDAFISSVSHELRTPLTSIVGYLELMSEGSMGERLPDEVTQGLSTIERNVDRLRSLVEDLLSLSAHDVQQVRLDLEVVDVLSLVHECQRMLAPATSEKQLEVVVVTDGEPARLTADPTHLQRVLHHLLHNAVKFSHPGGRVTMRVTSDRDHVRLSVSDEGIGIPREEQHRAFSRFFRSSLSDAQEIQGSGLGLALVRSMVEAHGGSVHLDSEEGRGTCVSIVLPGRLVLPRQPGRDTAGAPPR